jgi:hypothetical protein
MTSYGWNYTAWQTDADGLWRVGRVRCSLILARTSEGRLATRASGKGYRDLPPDAKGNTGGNSAVGIPNIRGFVGASSLPDAAAVLLPEMLLCVSMRLSSVAPFVGE